MVSSSSMPSVVVTLCHPSMANQRSLPGKHGTCDEVSNTFARLSKCPSAVEDSDLQALERFVVLMYDRSSDVTTVNEARLDLFARKQRQYDLTNSSSTQRACKTCFL